MIVNLSIMKLNIPLVIILILIIVLIILLFPNPKSSYEINNVNKYEKLIIGDWLLDSLSFYALGQEEMYTYKNGGYFTNNGQKEFFGFKNEGIIIISYNIHGESVLKSKEGKIILNVSKYKIENNKIYSTSLINTRFPYLEGMNSSDIIKILNQKNLILSSEPNSISFSDKQSPKTLTIEYYSRKK